MKGARRLRRARGRSARRRASALRAAEAEVRPAAGPTLPRNANGGESAMAADSEPREPRAAADRRGRRLVRVRWRRRAASTETRYARDRAVGLGAPPAAAARDPRPADEARARDRSCLEQPLNYPATVRKAMPRLSTSICDARPQLREPQCCCARALSKEIIVCHCPWFRRKKQGVEQAPPAAAAPACRT